MTKNWVVGCSLESICSKTSRFQLRLMRYSYKIHYKLGDWVTSFIYLHKRALISKGNFDIIISTRLEMDRLVTEKWLRNNNITCKKLILLPNEPHIQNYYDFKLATCLKYNIGIFFEQDAYTRFKLKKVVKHVFSINDFNNVNLKNI